MIKQYGFGAIAAIVILVILTLLATAIISIGTIQQTSLAQDILSTKAWQAARAGNEWGLYQVLKNSTCISTQTLDLVADSGFYVTVTCSSNSYTEVSSVTIYEITATACPSSSCPASDASVAEIGYIERTRVVSFAK